MLGDRVLFRQHMVGDFMLVEVPGSEEKLMLIPSAWVWAKESPSSSPAGTKATK